jgi:hypothetical protein
MRCFQKYHVLLILCAALLAASAVDAAPVLPGGPAKPLPHGWVGDIVDWIITLVSDLACP